MKTFILFNFFVYIIYSIIEYVCLNLGIMSGNLIEDLNSIIIISVIAMGLTSILMKKINDYI